MRRLFLLTLLVAFTLTGGYAQKKNVSLARNKALNTESPDIPGAKEAIKAALEDETTKNSADTWYVAGLVYETAAYSEQGDEQSNDAMAAYNYYLKAYELDLLPDAKGKVKPKYTKKIQNSLNIFYNRLMIANSAIQSFNNGDLTKAIDAFEAHANIPNLKMYEGAKGFNFFKDSTYYELRYWETIAYERNGDTIPAIELLESIKEEKIDNQRKLYICEHLCDLYKAINDTAKMLESYAYGMEKYPNDFYFLGNLINFYIYSGQEKEAIDYLNQAIAAEPNNAQYYYVLGSVMETTDKFDEAEANYDKALEVEPENTKALSSKGRMLFMKAMKYEERSVSQRDMKVADQLEAASIAKFKESLPYLEKVAELEATDVDNLRLLKQIYYRLSNKDKANSAEYQRKYQEINEKINAVY